MAQLQDKFLMYKDRPLVRSGDVIYYGSMSDPYVVMMKIVGKRDFDDMSLTTRIVVQLMSTDPTVRAKDRILKSSEKSGLSQALEIATIWLDRQAKSES